MKREKKVMESERDNVSAEYDSWEMRSGIKMTTTTTSKISVRKWKKASRRFMYVTIASVAI